MLGRLKGLRLQKSAYWTLTVVRFTKASPNIPLRGEKVEESVKSLSQK